MSSYCYTTCLSTFSIYLLSLSIQIALVISILAILHFWPLDSHFFHYDVIVTSFHHDGDVLSYDTIDFLILCEIVSLKKLIWSKSNGTGFADNAAMTKTFLSYQNENSDQLSRCIVFLLIFAHILPPSWPKLLNNYNFTNFETRFF